MSVFQNYDLNTGTALGQFLKPYETLTAASTAVNASGYSSVRLTSDDTTAANRLATLAAGDFVGHVVIIQSVLSGSYKFQVPATGLMKVSSGGVDFNSEDALTAIWTGSYWCQIAFSDN